MPHREVIIPSPKLDTLPHFKHALVELYKILNNIKDATSTLEGWSKQESDPNPLLISLSIYKPQHPITQAKISHP
jgi:hypothetical protein